MVCNPRHYLALIEIKPGALDHAGPPCKAGICGRGSPRCAGFRRPARAAPAGSTRFCLVRKIAPPEVVASAITGSDPPRRDRL